MMETERVLIENTDIFLLVPVRLLQSCVMIPVVVASQLRVCMRSLHKSEQGEARDRDGRGRSRAAERERACNEDG
jgi:hypothetical protein